MNEIINKDIFYHPSFEIERNYSSSANFYPSQEQQEYSEEATKELTSAEEIDKKSDEVIEILLKARKALPVIPERIRGILEEIIDKTIIHTAFEQDELAKIIEADKKAEEEFNKHVKEVTNNSNKNNEAEKNKDTIKNNMSILESNKDSINSIINILNSGAKETYSGKNNYKNTSQEHKDSYVEEEQNESVREENKISSGSLSSATEIFDRPDLGFYFPKPSNVKVIVKPTKKSTELAREQQLRDSIYIKEKFASKLNDAFQAYVYPLMTVMGESGVGKIDYLNIEYQGETVEGYNRDEVHLHDTIVRNQVIIEEQTRLFEKTNSPSMLNNIFTAFDVIAQQRIQYYAEEYKQGIGNFLEIYKRDILRESRKVYDDKYFKAKSNMYKYLNSTVMLTSDILKSNFNAYASKCYLLTKDVNIFARKEFTGHEVSNETNPVS